MAKSSDDGSTRQLNRWHLWGMAKRLGLTIDELPDHFSAGSGKPDNEIVAPNTAKKLSGDGDAFIHKSWSVFERVVNKTLAERRKALEAQGRTLPFWLTDIDGDWFKEPNPDAKFREHIPDYVMWENVVDADTQKDACEVFCGLYYLIRPHGKNPLNTGGSKNDSLYQVEICCIHQPQRGHIRIHLVNANEEINSGLAYVHGRTLSATLYRREKKTSFVSRTIMIHGPASGQENNLQAIVARMSGSRETPYASAAILVRLEGEEFNETLRRSISKTLYDYRAREREQLDFNKESAFKNFRPRGEVPPTDAMIKPHVRFLQDRIIRID